MILFLSETNPALAGLYKYPSFLGFIMINPRFIFKSVVALTLGAVLSSCGTYVNHQNSQANYAQDKYACEQEALRLMPTIIAYRYESTPAECRSKDREGRCTDLIRPTNKAIPYDTNEAARSHLVFSCIKAKGWEFERN